VYVLLGNGNGTFNAPQIFFAGINAKPFSVAVADVNGDGKLDVVVTNDGSNTVGVLLNTGNGNFTGQTYTIDTIDPSVVSINRATPVGPITTAASVSFTVTFSEPVTGVDPTDFSVPTTGSAVGVLSQITGSGSVYTVTISGVTGTGSLGLNVVDNGSLRDFTGNPLKTGSSAPFLAQQTYALTGGSASVAAADVNGDGIPDLIAADGGSNVVSVLLGNGDGTFQNRRTFAAGVAPQSVVVADVNADGNADLIVTNAGSSNVSVLLNIGNETFLPQQTFATQGEPEGVAVADVNGDGKLDLAVTDSDTNNISVLLGNGNGTFQNQLTFAVGITPTSVAIADVNEDGKPDLLVGSQDGASVSVLLGNGNGTFQAQQTFPAASPVGISVSDVNADGKPDVLVADIFSNTLSVLLGNGNGTFQNPITFATGVNPEKVVVADLNGDGNPDLLVSNFNSNNVSMLLGNGNGTFQSQQTLAAGLHPLGIVVSDVNRDDRPDIVVDISGGSLGVMLNAGNGNFTGQTYNIVPSLDTITGTTGVDQVSLAEDTDDVDIDWFLNGIPSGQMAINDPNGLTINGNGSNDVITLDYTHGDPLPNKLNLNGVFTLNGLVTTGNPLANTTLDLEKSTLFINYGVPANDPMTTVLSYLKTGYNNGAWTGTSANGSIRSSAAAANVNQTTAIGYSDSADGQGVNTTPNTIELKYTLYGDTHLLGTVGFADFSKLTQTFGNNTGGTWSTGDWTYDGSVNFSDFNLLTRTYGTPLGSQADVPAAAPTPSSEVAATPSSEAAATPTQSAALITADTSDNKKSAKATAKSKPVTTVTVKPAKAKANAKKPRH